MGFNIYSYTEIYELTVHILIPPGPCEFCRVVQYVSIPISEIISILVVPIATQTLNALSVSSRQCN